MGGGTGEREREKANCLVYIISGAIRTRNSVELHDLCQPSVSDSTDATLGVILHHGRIVLDKVCPIGSIPENRFDLLS